MVDNVDDEHDAEAYQSRKHDPRTETMNVKTVPMSSRNIDVVMDQPMATIGNQGDCQDDAGRPIRFGQVIWGICMVNGHGASVIVSCSMGYLGARHTVGVNCRDDPRRGIGTMSANVRIC